LNPFGLITKKYPARIQPLLPNAFYEHRQERSPSVFRRLITSLKITKMATMDDRRKPLVDLEHRNLPDPAAEAVGSVLPELPKRQERLTVLERAGGIASTRDESLEKIMIEAAFSQGGQI
jgi:hypothetical protein